VEVIAQGIQVDRVEQLDLTPPEARTREFPEMQGELAMAQERGDSCRTVVAQVLLGHAAFGLGEVQGSAEHLRQALKRTVQAGWTRYALCALVGLARLLVHQTEPERAAELLALVLHHPASAQVTKDRAQHLLAELESTLPAEVFAEATVRGPARELDDVLSEVPGACWVESSSAIVFALPVARVACSSIFATQRTICYTSS